MGVQTDAPFPEITAKLSNLVREVRALQCRVFELTYVCFLLPQLYGQLIQWPSNSGMVPPHQPSAPSNRNLPLPLLPPYLLPPPGLYPILQPAPPPPALLTQYHPSQPDGINMPRLKRRT
ncbi:hypothetical protein PoB_000000600 [Plakobranchus ocellatus]|uniref:Uncharacterized protein n=1 Tax=Plakobranchus ocellatus TaxID=259542 RepID=A0AAV3XQ41_9GAST|nr:hypothetical protein PoB_000000600 [Plakobranchus ocellatus]